MAGLENILSIISSQQKQSENAVISAAEKKAAAIAASGSEKAAKEYEEYLKKAKLRLEQEHKNAESSVDGEMKRKLLSFKVGVIDDIAEKTLKKLDTLPDKEYFAVLEKLLAKRVHEGEGVLELSKRDLGRITDGFKASVAELAKKSGGTVKIADSAANIENGFILTYGLISENCSFRAILEADKEGVRDTAAKALFG